MKDSVFIYVHGLRPLAARKRNQDGSARERSGAWARICSLLSNNVDSRMEKAMSQVLAARGIEYASWSYLDAAAQDSAFESVDEAAAALAFYVEERHGSKSSITLFGHSFGGVIALHAASAWLSLARVRVITAASPLRGATLLRWAVALGFSQRIKRIWGPIALELASDEPVIDDDALGIVGERHLNIVFTNPLVAFDGRVFAADQSVYGSGGSKEHHLHWVGHTWSMGRDRRLLALLVENAR